MKRTYFMKISCILILIAIIALICVFSVSVFAEEDDTIYYVGGNTEANTFGNANYYKNYPEGSRIVQTEYVGLPNGCPLYYNNNQTLTNCCANVTGAMLIGFYDRYIENLIPNVSTYRAEYNMYAPMGWISNEIQSLISDLYTRMGTNTIKPGTSESQFFSGMEQICNAKNLNIAKESVKYNDGLNLNSVKQALNNNKPVVVFASKHNTISISSNVINIVCSDIPHIFVASGYSHYKVYSHNNLLLDEFYVLRASKGIAGAVDAIIVDSDYFTIDNAYIFEIR